MGQINIGLVRVKFVKGSPRGTRRLCEKGFAVTKRVLSHIIGLVVTRSDTDVYDVRVSDMLSDHSLEHFPPRSQKPSCSESTSGISRHDAKNTICLPSIPQHRNGTFQNVQWFAASSQVGWLWELYRWLRGVYVQCDISRLGVIWEV